MSSFPSAEFFDGEYLTINGIQSPNPMFMFLDLADLWIVASTWENRVAPATPGSIPLPGVQDELVTTLPMWIKGARDWEGNPYPRVQQGFRRNWRYLNNNLFLPPGAGFYTAVYQSPDPDEDPISFPIQVRAPKITDRNPTMWEGTVEVCLPDGALA
jgi:hypothetical protein